MLQLFKRVLRPLQFNEQSSTKLACNIRLNIIHGIFNVAALDMVNPFLSIFAIRLGASKFQVALLSSAPAAISLLAMIPGARLIDLSPRKKRLTFLFMLIHRVFFLVMASIPFFDSSNRALIFVGLIALMNLPGAIGNVAWQSFISRIIPVEHRAIAFANRNRLMNLVGTSVTLTAGLLLDRLKFAVGYQIIFITAFLIGMFEMVVFNQIEEETIPEPVPLKQSPKDQSITTNFLKELLSETQFLWYTFASVIFYFGWQIAWPLFSWYQVKVLGANNMWVSMLALMNNGGSLVGYGFWIKVINRHGNLKTLFFSTMTIFIVPLIYAFSHNLYIVALFNLIVGAIFSGVNLALFNALLEMTPESRKTTYIAYYNTAITISAIIAPLAGVSLLKFVNFQWAFIICAGLRVLGSLCFLAVNRLREQTIIKPVIT